MNLNIGTKYNRTLVLIVFMILVGWIAYLVATNMRLKVEAAVALLGIVAPTVSTYVAIKGRKGDDQPPALPPDPGGD